MLITILSGVVYGVQSRLIQVEVDVSQGLPCFQIVGLPGSEVREAKERVKVALKNVGGKTAARVHQRESFSGGSAQKRHNV